jgi:hypothetical protein
LSALGFIVTNLARPSERVVTFYNQRGAAEQYIKEGKGAIKWTRLLSGPLGWPVANDSGDGEFSVDTPNG